MGIDNFFVHDVTILHPTSVVDTYNNTVDDWAAPTTTATKGWLARTRTQEVLDRRDAQLTDWTLFLPVGTAIAATDRVVINGTTYEVNGPPNEAWTPRGAHHLEVQLAVVTG